MWRAFERTAEPYRGTPLWDGDFVHADFHTANVLVEDGRVTAVVDLEPAGKGTRVSDLMTLLMYAYYDELVGKPVRDAAAVRQRLWDYALNVRGPGEVVVCMVSNIIGMMEWSVRHDTQKDVDALLETGRRFLADLAVRTV